MEKQPRRYLRRKHLRERYGWESERSVDRAIRDGRLPPPDLIQGRFPLWDEYKLDTAKWNAPAQATPAQQPVQTQTPAVPAPEQRQVGQIYPTPRGPARWLGSGWQLVQMNAAAPQ
jgi:hypothetical protein